MRRAAAPSGVVVVVALASLWVLPGAAATIAVDTTHLDLGKLDPGHRSAHEVAVTNTGTALARLAMDVLCDCPHYVTVAPATVELAPGQRAVLDVTVAVADDAGPGIHNTRIRITEVATTGPGGTGQAAYEVDATFWVRTARVYHDPVQADDTLPLKIVNGHDEALEVTFTGRLVGAGIDRPWQVPAVTAPGSTNARTTHVIAPLPFAPDDPPGLYEAEYTATWTHPVTGATVSSGATRVEIARGAAVVLSGFTIDATDTGAIFRADIENTGGVPVAASLAVDIVRASGATVTVEGPAAGLAPGEKRAFEAVWSDAAPGQYTAAGRAVFTTGAGQSGASDPSAAQPFSVDDGTSDGGGARTLPASWVGTALVAAGAAGIGAAIATAIVRRRRAD